MFRLSIFTYVVLSSVFLGAFLAHFRTLPTLEISLPERLGGFTESARKVRCASAIKREEVLYVAVESLQEFRCVELYLEMFGGLKPEEYRKYILAIQGKRYGDEIFIGFDPADLFLGKKTPRQFPQLYVLLIRFSLSGQGVMQRLSDKYIELLAFRFDEMPKLIKREALKDGLFYEQFIQREEVFSEEGMKIYMGQIFRILTEDSLMILSGINLSKEVWGEILAEVIPFLY